MTDGAADHDETTDSAPGAVPPGEAAPAAGLTPPVAPLIPAAGVSSASVPDALPPQKGRLKRTLLPLAMRYALLRRGIGIQVVYRSNGGGLVVGGLSYAALFALIPTIILVVAGVFFLVDDPRFRQEAVDLINRAFPALSGFTDTAVLGAHELAAVGGIIAIVGFMWGASGLYLNLTRAMERFFPGERVSGSLARVVGVLLVLVMIVAVLAAVFMAGVVTVVAQALQLDVEWILTAVSVVATMLLGAVIVYAIYRVIPANPPGRHSARLPAALVGVAIALITLLYSLVSPWLVTGFEVFGVAASVFAALVWLRVVFLAIVYGAAMTRYRDFVYAADVLGEAEPDRYATQHALQEEAELAAREVAATRLIEQRRAHADAVVEARDERDASARDG
jgi:uncharacterized BrkB/YihY/UPF0761 family membrane protein